MNDRAFSRKHNPRADPRFAKAIERGFMVQEEEFGESIEIMRMLKAKREEAIAAGNENPRFVDSNGEEFYYVEPDYMEEAQQHLREYQDRVVGALREAPTSQEQRDILLKFLQDSFYANIFTARPALTTQLMENAFEIGHEIYQNSSYLLTDTERQAETDNVLIPINRTAKTFWKEAIRDTTDYAVIVSDAGDDLRDLAIAYVDKHGIESEGGTEGLDSPGALAALRYGRVVGMDGTAPHFTIDHPLKFSEIMEKLMKDDLFGPYQEVFDGNAVPELAWFIGRSMEVLHAEQEATPHHRTPILKVHDAITPEGRLPKLYDKLKVTGARVRFADTIAMMQDETMQARASELMTDTLSSHPNVAASIGGLLDASREFLDTHKLRSTGGAPDLH